MAWTKRYLPVFVNRIKTLYAIVSKQKELSPRSYVKSSQYLLLKSIIKSIDLVAENPAHKDFLQGNTLGKKHRDWRRVKHSLPQRYRMFFKFFTTHNDIIYAWINDEHSLRKKGAKTDCYYLFIVMLESGDIPSTHEMLSEKSVESLTGVSKNSGQMSRLSSTIQYISS